jgi:hypothetical protein
MSSQFVFVKNPEGATRKLSECDNCFMPLPIYVDEYSGHRANQRPRSFTVDEQVFNIEAVLDQWYEPSGTYFKVQTTERKVYLLRYDGEGNEWTLQSGFDGDELFARPSIEFITVGPEVIHRVEKLTESCEHCHPGDAEIPFDWLLADVIAKHGPFEFILAEPARCPNCKHEVTEKTLTDPRQD